MGSHPFNAGLTGLVIGGWFAFRQPLGAKPIAAAGAGFVMGVAMYALITLIYTIETARNA